LRLNAGRVETIFEQALEFTGAERDAFVGGACGDDGALMQDVRSLLAAHERSGILEAAASDLAELAGAEARREEPIGPYQVLRRRGRGGMGEVYLAERQILASLDHPASRPRAGQHPGRVGRTGEASGPPYSNSIRNRRARA
jgi:serine/threonine protein kinase